VVALNNSAVFYGHRRELPRLQQQAEALLVLATAHGFPPYIAVGTILQGVVLAEQGHGEEGIAQAHQGLAALREARAELPRPFFLVLLAETCGRIGQVAEGLKLLEEVQAVVNKTGAHIHEAELFRLKGELTLQKGARSLNRGTSSSSPRAPSLQPQMGRSGRRRNIFSKSSPLPASNTPNPSNCAQ
jgi:predicted ATPase